MTKDINRSLEDLSFLSKRLAGLFSLGEDLQGVQTLLNQRDDLTRSVEGLSQELTKMGAKIKAAEQDYNDAQVRLDSINKDVDNATKARTQSLREYDNYLISVQLNKDTTTKEMEAYKANLLKEIQTEAENLKAQLAKDITIEQVKLETIKSELNRLKHSL